MNITEADRRAIVNWARRHREIKAVYLYGSRARGDNRPDSDIDLAVVMRSGDEDEALGAWIFFHNKFEKRPDLQLSQEVDLDWYMKGAGLERVGPGVEKNGILIYPPKMS